VKRPIALAALTDFAPALRALAALSLLSMTGAGVARADVKEPTAGQWSGGAGVGFLANTPDGVEFGVSANADYFLTQRLSIGLLFQYAGAGNDILVGASIQAKYWWNISASRTTKLVVQGGIGGVRAAIEDADSGVSGTYTSFLIPLGIGVDYAVTPRIALTADIRVNFTCLGEKVRTREREVDLRTNVMPGLFLGVRF
jgi:hypothetical protein